MKKMLLLLCVLVAHKISFAQYQTPTVDGTIGGSEYANSYTSGSGNYYITWNATTLFVAVNFGNSTNDAINLYIDHNPIAVVNGGTNSNGTLSGTNYDQTTPNLPFRADFRAFVKTAYDDYVTANGSGSWNSSVAGGITKAISGSVIEFSIPWSSVTGSGIPSSFNFLLYRSYDANFNTGTYSTAPTANPALSNCTSSCTRSVTQPYYFTVSSTTNGSSTAAFSRISYATGSGSATLSNATDYFDFTLNSSSATLSSGAHNVSGTLTVTNGGSLTTGGLLTLKSTASNTARVAAVSGTISGNVTCERYIPGGRRAFRFLSHPFNSSLALSSLTDNIDITGTGGSPMTTTGSNTPSAFSYDNTVANSSLTSDPGWTALTASSSFNALTGYRILVRGSKGQAGSLTGGTYTPNPVTLDWTGALNQGNQTVTITNNGTNRTYTLVGNPYASPVDLSLITRGSNINANFSVWDPNVSTRGAYVTQAFSTSYILPSGSAFFTQSSANTSNTITFTEASKSSGTPTSVFRTTTTDETLTLEVQDANGNYVDQLQFLFNSSNKNYTANNDALWDAEKMTNPDVNFYSFSKDNTKLAIDRRPAIEESIALGFTAAEGTYIINVKALPSNQVYYLKDNYLGTTTALSSNTSITIKVTADAASYGNARFALVTKQIAPISNASFTVTVSPNPVKDLLQVSYTGLDEKESSSIIVVSTEGKTVKNISLGKVQAGKQSISMQAMAAGTYNVLLMNGATKQTVQIVKQ